MKRLVVAFSSLSLFVAASVAADSGTLLTNAFYAMDTAFQRPGLDAGQQLDLVKELGFAGIAWHEQAPAEARAAALAAEARGLTMSAIYCAAQVTPAGELSCSPALPALMEALRGHHTIIWLHLGGQGPAVAGLSGAEPLFQKLRRLADTAAANGLRIALYPHYGEWTARFGDATRVARLAGHPALGVTFNLCHCLATGDEPQIAALLKEAAPVLVTVTLNGADAGVQGPDWGRLIQPLNRGTFDAGRVLRELNRVGFTGPVGFQGYGITGDARSILEPTMARWRELVPAGAEADARMQWWREARFGLFIHWDMSSLAGTEISWSRKGSKPLDVTGDPAGYVEDSAYDNLYKNFNPVNFDARAWVKLAQGAGMKYLVFTAKHHGGFCMWDTKLTDYSITHTAFKRDVVGELAQACHEAGLRFGLYYSPRDWHHPDYGRGDNHLYHEYLKGQLTELLTYYGTVDVMWFDSFGHGDSISYWHADEILRLVKHLQPQIVVNNRCSFFGQPVASLAGDFDTPEQRLGSFQNTRDWESCLTLVHCPDGGGWSYRPDGKLRSLAECIGSLVGCATGDGNLLLDAGPNALGIIPADQAARLREIGGWLRQSGPSIYDTHGGPYRNGRWGGSTYRGNTVYLHIAAWDGGQLELPPLTAKVLACTSLAGPEATLLHEQTDRGLRLTRPAGSLQAPDTVIALTLSGPAENEFNHGQPIDVP